MTTNTSLPMIDFSGKAAGELKAPATVFGVTPNENAVHFVCEGQRWSFYKKTVAVKTRSAVHGSNKKVRQQKGSGGSRQGNIRSPIQVGGGIVFGPSPIKRAFKINKKTRRLALTSVLSDRASGGQIRIIKGDLKAPKTSSIAKLIESLSMSDARVGFVLDAKTDANLVKSVRNLKKADCLTQEKWTPLDFVKTDALIFSESAFKQLVDRLSAEGAN